MRTARVDVGLSGEVVGGQLAGAFRFEEVLGDFPAVVGGGGGGAVLGRRGFQTSTEGVEVDTRGRRQGRDIVPISESIFAHI